jgi:hypothetical protein
MSITRCEGVFVTLVIQHAMRMRHTFICGLPYFSTLPHKLHDSKIKFLNIKCVFWFPLQLLYETFLILRRTERDMLKMSIGLGVKYPYYQIFMELEFSQHICEKCLNIQSHVNPCSGGQVVPCGRTWN